MNLSKMATSKFKFVGYLETTGGPVCICSAAGLKEWTGSEEETGLYWRAISELGVQPLEVFLDKFYLFNSETGNFILFRNDDEIVIAEIISVEPSFAMPWEGIEFSFEDAEHSSISISGLTAFFDSALTLNNWGIEEGLLAMNEASAWNAAFIKGEFSIAKYVYYRSENIDMYGVLLTN